MAELYPPLPPDLIAFAESGLSLLVGTCSASLEPDCVRGVGVRIWPDGRHMTLLLPAATGKRSVANLRENPRLAMTLSHVPSHRTMQVKGPVLEVRDGTEDDRTLARQYLERFAVDLAFLGQPAANTLRLGHWPCHAIDIAIEVVFVQTPGPSAGDRLPLTGDSRL